MIDREQYLDLVPEAWKTEPTTLLTELGEKIGEVRIVHTPKMVVMPSEVQTLSKRLDEVAEQNPNFFNGKLTHVDKVGRFGSDFDIFTRDTTFFDYVAAGYYYGGLQGTQEKNPLTVFAVQSVFLTPDNRILFERKSASATEFPKGYHLFGGSLAPDETDPIEAMQSKIKKKWKVNLAEEQIQTTGVELDTVNNVLHIFYLNRLSEEQFKTVRNQYSRWEGKIHHIREEILHYPPLTIENIKRLLEHQPVTKWNPPAFDDLLCGIAASGLVGVEELKKIREENIKMLQEKPFEYNYPYKKYALIE